MEGFWSLIEQGWNIFFSVISDFNFGDLLDIVLVAYLIYKAVQLIRETRAAQLVKGIMLLVVVVVLVKLFQMDTMDWLIENMMDAAVFAVLVVFQPELRRMLEQMGRSRIATLGHSLSSTETEQEQRMAIEATCKACASMSASKTGALIVFERQTMLGEVIATGTIIDGAVSTELLGNIFFNKAPLHDGGLIIRRGRVQAAACILPLSQNEINRELGTRHRAALGMSEVSDAVVVVVSEETGIISVARNGVLTRGYDSITLSTELEKALLPSALDEDSSSKPFWKRWKKK